MLHSVPVRALLCLLVLGCQAAPPVRVDPEAYDALTAVREKLGAETLFAARDGYTLAGLRTRRAADGTELRQPIVLSARPNGDFLVSTGVSEDAVTRGFDGEDAWIAHGNGVVRSVGLGARESLVLDGWLRSQLWLLPGSMGLEIDLLGAGTDEATLAFEIGRPGEPAIARVDVDRGTLLPREYRIERFGSARRVVFEDWNEEGGLMLPARTSEWYEGELVAVDDFERRTAGSPPTFAAPRSAPEDTEFDLGSEVLDTRVDSGGRYYVRATFEGDEDRAAWLLLDTGFGAHAISALTAQELELPSDGATRLSGVGGEGRSAWHVAPTLRLGPLEHRDVRFAAIDTAHLSARAGFRVDGILGAPLFERAIVVLDGRAKSVSLFEPGRLAADELRWRRIELDGTAPCVLGAVRATLHRTPDLWFRLDTGSDDTLTVARWAVQRFDLDADRTRLRSASLVGLFGELRGWRTKVAALEFGGVERRGIEITFLAETGPGPLADPWLAGNLGARALVGLRVVLDLGRRRIAIE